MEGTGSANLGAGGGGAQAPPQADCSLLGLRFKHHPVLKGLGERERGTWQRSRNQHYDNAIASLFPLAFPKPRDLSRWGSSQKEEAALQDVNQAYRVDVFIDHFSNRLIKFQIEIFIFMALLHDRFNTGGHCKRT